MKRQPPRRQLWQPRCGGVRVLDVCSPRLGEVWICRTEMLLLTLLPAACAWVLDSYMALLLCVTRSCMQVADCQVKLQRADKLIGGLGGERTRWSATVQQLQSDLHNVVGDVVLAAGGNLLCVVPA